MSNTRGDHSGNHAKTWYCGEGKGSQLGGREHKPKLRKRHAERGTERTEGLRGSPPRNTARTTRHVVRCDHRTHAEHYHVARETGTIARGRRGSSLWQREPVVENRRRLRAGGWELKCKALEPRRHRSQRVRTTSRRSSTIRVRRRCAAPQEDGGVRTQDGRRRPVTDWEGGSLRDSRRKHKSFSGR